MKLNFDHGLNPGDTIKNKNLVKIFKISTQGGMRRSLTTNTLTLVSDYTRGIYNDRWVNDILHYTGMGLEGDQRIDVSQNRTLAESSENGVEVFLFEVFESGEYIFQGQVKLVDKPYQEKQLDKNENERNVWIFPLKLSNKPIVLSETILLKKQEKMEKAANKLSDNELQRRLKYAKKNIGKRQVNSTSYERNPLVAEYAKRRANGVCELCEQQAPFKTKRGEYYLESHHLIWLSKNGEDTINNTVALCPNCHRKMHSLNLKKDIRQLKAKAKTFMI